VKKPRRKPREKREYLDHGNCLCANCLDPKLTFYPGFTPNQMRRAYNNGFLDGVAWAEKKEKVK
jgi:hypothetical protein